jgi:SAM-dependent methyltransferase
VRGRDEWRQSFASDPRYPGRVTDGTPQDDDDERRRTRASYDTVAHEYATRFHDELTRKPFDRAMLTWLAGRVPAGSLVADLGCGPGHVGAFLAGLGQRVHGIDLSPALVAEAARRFPGIPFSVGDMTRLVDWPAAAFGAIVAFYSIIHVPRAELATALAELARVLAPGGVLLLSFHVGEETRHLESWWDRPVDVRFHFHLPAAMAAALAQAGLVVTESIEREPYAPEVEVQTRRAYLFAVRPT